MNTAKNTKPVELTADNFQAHVERGIVLIDFWASWCGPCRAFAPVFEAAARRHPDVVFAKVDTDAQSRLARTFQIRSIPTLAVFRDGVLLGMQSGALPAEAVDELVRGVKALDMADVRRRLAADEHGQNTGRA